MMKGIFTEIDDYSNILRLPSLCMIIYILCELMIVRQCFTIAFVLKKKDCSVFVWFACVIVYA